MELTKELLEERRAQLLADYHALQGALQQLDWSLEILDKAPPEAEMSLEQGPEEE